MCCRIANGALLLVLLFLIPVPATALTPGRITVTSVPSFAPVCIDGVQCDTTPANFAVSGNAWHTVNVTESGYLPWSESIYVLTDQTSLVTADLLPDTSPTGIQVIVHPGGGTVCLDNILCRQGVGSSDTDGSTLFLDPGEGYHIITVNNTPGYLPYSTRPYVMGRGFVTLHADLDPVLSVTASPSSESTTLLSTTTPAGLTPGRITVWSQPSFARVCIDAGQCDTTPANFGVPGNAWHTVNVTESGYLPWSKSIYVLTDQTSLVNATLQPDNGITGIQVFVRPGGGTICLDNADCHTHVGAIGGTGLTQFTGLGEGYHIITVNETDGYLPYTTRAYVTQRGFNTVYVTLDPVPVRIDPNTSRPVVTQEGFVTIPRESDQIPPPSSPPVGVIRVYVNRAGSTICIDNHDCRELVGGPPGPGGGTTIFTDVSANTPHTINLSAEGFGLSSNTVSVGTGKIMTLNVTLASLQGLAGGTPTVTDSEGIFSESSPGPASLSVFFAIAAGALFFFRVRNS